MKTKVFLYMLFLSPIIFITSCLGDEGQMVSVANQPGVVIKTSEETKIQLRDIEIYSDKFGSNVDNEDCLILKYNIDFGIFANSDTGRLTGSYKAEILQTDTVHKEPLLTELTDTVAVLDNEQLLSSVQQRYAIIQNQLFLYTEHRTDSLQLYNSFQLSYNPNQAPDVEDGKKIYNVFLRIQKIREGEIVDSPDKIFVNAFNISDLLAKDDTVYFRVKYANSFNKDTTEISHWSSVEYKYPADIKREGF